MPRKKKRRHSGGTAEIGRRLRELRKQHGLTQSELARQIGIQQSDLSRMEKGEYRVSLENLFRILAVFGMDAAEFFAREPIKAQKAEPLSHEDMRLLQVLRQLDPQARREVQEFAEFKLRKQRREASTDHRRSSETEVG